MTEERANLVFNRPLKKAVLRAVYSGQFAKVSKQVSVIFKDAGLYGHRTIITGSGPHLNCYHQNPTFVFCNFENSQDEEVSTTLMF